MDVNNMLKQYLVVFKVIKFFIGKDINSNNCYEKEE